jgi:hypothetical protein
LERGDRTGPDATFRAALILGIVLLATLRLAAGTGNLIDDAYLTLRTARNLAAGEGLLYNPGDRLLGTTTPLYAVTVGSIGKFVGADKTLWIAVLLNLAADVVSYLLLARLGARLTGDRWFGLAAALCFAIDRRVLEYSTGGMEAPVYTALILSALTMALENRPLAAGIAAGFVVLCRPDGAWTAAVVLGSIAWRRRAIPWGPALAAVAVAAPWFLFAAYYYGHPLPPAVLAKASRPWLEPWYQAAQAIFLQGACFFQGRLLFFELPGRLTAHLGTSSLVQTTLGVSLVIGVLVNFLLARAGILAMWRDPVDPPAWPTDRRRHAVVVLGLFVLGYMAMYAVGNPVMFGWYQVPIEPFGLLFVGSGLWTLGRRALASAGDAGRRLAVPATLTLLVALQAGHYLSDPPRGGVNLLRDRWDKSRERLYSAVAERLNAVSDRSVVILNPECGAFGYHSRATTLDPVGLVSRGMARYYPVPADQHASNYALPPQLVLDRRPDYLVTLEIFVRNSCLRSPEFLSAYELVEAVPSTTFDSRGLLIFRRRDEPRGQLARRP